MLAQQPQPNTANLQSRSQQPLLPNLQQPTLLNQAHPFLGQPIAWPPGQPPLMAQNSLGHFVLHTPTMPHILLPNQQSKGPAGQVQFVQTGNVPAGAQKPPGETAEIVQLPEEEASDDGTSTGSDTEKVNLTPATKLKAIKKSSRERNRMLNDRQMVSSKIMKNQTKKLRITHKPGHKSTQQMNDELLMFEAQRKEAESAASAASAGSGKSSASLDGSRDSLRTMKRKLKSEKKKISIVKPRVVITHKVNEYLIHESDHPFTVSENGDEDAGPKAINGHKNGDSAKEGGKLKEGKKLRKYRKWLKTKSTGSANGEAPSSSTDLIDISSPSNSTGQLQMVELSEDDQKSLPALSSTQNGGNPTGGPIKVETQSEPANEAALLPDANIYRWSIDDVYQFVLETTSNEKFATALKREQFDGESLALLTIPILREIFDLKLGPILSLKKKIESFKEQSRPAELSDYLPAGGANIFKWSVKDVYQFVLRLTSKTVADQFEAQEMDGHSLTLITCENIRNDLNVSYGPALKIITRIGELKEKATGK